jgi:hypothetical protein
MRYILLAITISLAAPALGQLNCSNYKKGKFEYVDMPGAWFEIKGNRHMEYVENGKYYIQSTLKWNSDCSYTTTLRKCTVPGFPYKPGDEMTVTFHRNEEGVIYYTSVLRGEKMEGRVRKVD